MKTKDLFCHTTLKAIANPISMTSPAADNKHGSAKTAMFSTDPLGGADLAT